MTRTLALLGDSILDNRTYTAPELDTATHLRHRLGSGWDVYLLAVDGSVMEDIQAQSSQLKGAADLIVLSVGGNDAMAHLGMLMDRATRTHALLDQLMDLTEAFGTRYREILGHLQGWAKRIVICTIYEPPFLDPALTRHSRVPLGLLNDQIVRSAAELGFELLDLRAICTEANDFVEEIEPSAAGAAKIAAAIAALAG